MCCNTVRPDVGYATVLSRCCPAWGSSCPTWSSRGSTTGQTLAGTFLCQVCGDGDQVSTALVNMGPTVLALGWLLGLRTSDNRIGCSLALWLLHTLSRLPHHPLPLLCTACHSAMSVPTHVHVRTRLPDASILCSVPFSLLLHLRSTFTICCCSALFLFFPCRHCVCCHVRLHALQHPVHRGVSRVCVRHLPACSASAWTGAYRALSKHLPLAASVELGDSHDCHVPPPILFHDGVAASVPHSAWVATPSPLAGEGGPAL